ncbi:MAG: TonB-dependent receptor [Steroidobacteraceae bacterium]
MLDAFRRAVVVVAITASLIASPAADAAGASLVGRPVVEVLRELRGPGLEFIYSSELLPQSVSVLAEPRSGNRLLIAREILKAHGLALSVVRPGLFAVVRERRAIVQGPVAGQVVNAQNGQPVTAARVELQPLGAVQWSDARGRFSLGLVPEGTYSLRAWAAGFESLELPEFRVSEAGATAELQLLPATTELAEVVVATSRYGFDRSDGFGAVLLDGDSLAAQPSIGEDAIRALGRLPGIAQTGLSAQSSIRGGEAGDVLTLVDGFPIRQAFHLPGYQSVFGLLDPGVIEKAQVFTGGFPVRYGNRLAGVFDLQTIDASTSPRTALGLSFFNASARSGGNLEPLGADWLVSARGGVLRQVLHAVANDAGSPTYGDVYARMGFGDIAGLRISGNLLWSRDELSISREARGEDAQIESRTRYLWLRADHDWGDDLQASLWLGHSEIDSVRTGTIDSPAMGTGGVDDHRASQIADLRGRLAWRPGVRHWLEAGVEWTQEDAHYRYASIIQFPDTVATLFGRDPMQSRQIELDPERERASLFVTHRWQLTDRLVSELGLRAQRTITDGTTTEDWLYDPRVNLRWQVADATSLRMHWGRFVQTDEVQELKVEDGLTAFPGPQRSDHLIVGVDHRLPGGTALRIEGFRKLQSAPRPRFENLLDTLTLMPEIAPDRVLIAPQSAEMRGLELTVTSENTDATRWLSVAWSDAVDHVGGQSVPRSWDQTWAITAGIDRIRGNWRLGAIASAHRGWPTTHVEDDTLGARNRDRLPVFATLDLRAEYRRPLAIGSLALTFELTNALNRHNSCCSELIANQEGSGATNFDTRARDWLPILPSIGVLWEF